MNLRTALLAATVFAAPLHGRQPEPATERTPALAAWESLHYGMFIHFGLSTFINNECPHGDTKPSDYNPTALDVDQWIRTARDAGMTYAELTTKHCAGHCLWPSAFTDHSVATSPNTADVVRQFVDACAKYGIKPGFYYLLGWDSRHQPRMAPDRYEQFCKDQLAELLTNYGPIQQVFLDIPFDMGPDTGGALARMYTHIKSLQPGCLVLPNQAFVDGSAVTTARPSYFWKDVGLEPVALWPRDLMDGERTLPPQRGHDPRIAFNGRTYYLPMETCDTLCEHWFWEAGDTPRPTRMLYKLYQACIDRHANLLLDVGPDRTGRISEPCVARLMELKAAIDRKTVFARPLTAGRPAKASNVYHDDPQSAAGKAVDDGFSTRWATDGNQSQAWLEVDLGGPTPIAGAYIREAFNRVRAFQIEVPDGPDRWKPIYRGQRIGDGGVEIKFEPVTADRVRLNITDGPGGPTIWEFEVYGPTP